MIKEINDFMGDYTVAKLKKMPSRNGYAWSCDILENNVLIGSAMDQGNGGMVMVHIQDKNALERLEKYATSKGFDFEAAGSFLGQACDYADLVKKLTSTSKKKTLFVFKNDNQRNEHGVYESWSSINSPFTPELKEQILNKYPNQIECFLNEEFVAPAKKVTAKKLK